ANTGAITVTGTGNEIDNESAAGVSNSGTIEVKAAAALTLTGDTRDNTSGPLTVAGTGPLPLASTTISKGTLANNGALDLTGSDKIQTGALANTGAITVTGPGTKSNTESA